MVRLATSGGHVTHTRVKPPSRCSTRGESGFPHGYTGDDNGPGAGLKNWDKTLISCTLPVGRGVPATNSEIRHVIAWEKLHKPIRERSITLTQSKPKAGGGSPSSAVYATQPAHHSPRKNGRIALEYAIGASRLGHPKRLQFVGCTVRWSSYRLAHQLKCMHTRWKTKF
jgi:hypothetical protein